MKKTLLLSIAMLILLATALSSVGSCQMLNPYEPYNAVAAEPRTPYNLREIPRVSRVFYVPCPWWRPYADYLPDAPPVCQPFPGPFGIPVPVP
jgi:hypothetical protein